MHYRVTVRGGGDGIKFAKSSVEVGNVGIADARGNFRDGHCALREERGGNFASKPVSIGNRRHFVNAEKAAAKLALGKGAEPCEVGGGIIFFIMRGNIFCNRGYGGIGFIGAFRMRPRGLEGFLYFYQEEREAQGGRVDKIGMRFAAALHKLGEQGGLFRMLR